MRSTTSSRTRRVAPAILCLMVAAAASACGGGGSDDDGGASTAVTTGSELTTSVTMPGGGAPVDGGKLIYGIEAETSGFNPYLDRFAPAGQLMALAVYDPLAAFDAEGVAKAYLAESITTDDGGSLWTIQLRPDVTFHDGSVLDAEALATHLERLKESFLTQSAVRPIDGVTVTGPLTVTVSMTTPWVTFPVALVGQAGVVPAPGVPEEQLSDAPVGTGPFSIGTRVRDESTSMVKNNAYWQAGLPHLDEVVFRPLQSVEDRGAAFRSGEIDMFHTTNEIVNAQLLGQAQAGELQYVRDTGEQEELFVMFNTAAPPFDDVRLRRAASYAIDVDKFLEVSGQGFSERAEGPFSPSSPWYADVEFPTGDPAQAEALVAEVEAETGPVTVELNCADSRDSLELCQQLADDWAVVGIDASIVGLQQDLLINYSIAGKYESVLWRQFGSPDPDGDQQWWIGPIEGQTSLNFSRIADPELDAALEAGRSTDDVAARKEAYTTVQERFADQAPYAFLERIGWVIIADNDVRDFQNQALPDGTASAPYVNGIHRVGYIWIDR